MGEAERVSLHQLIIHRVLGQGATGTVFLAAFLSRPSHPPFALKIVHPDSSAREDALRRAQWEVEVLSLLLRHPHPFLPSLFATLDDADLPNSLPGWAIPFCPTGDLNALRYLQTDRVFSVAAIRFYAAEILLALSHLHSLRIVYRDLKPENVLIRESGHLMLADFDLSKLLLPAVMSPPPPPPQQAPLAKEAHDHIEKKQKKKARHRRSLTRFLAAASSKVSPISQFGIRRRSSFAGETALPVSEVVEKTYSFVGTEEYVAPEMVRGDGHGFPVDWWAFGVLLYEMMYGMTLFKGGTRKETFHNVLHQPPEFMGPASTSTAPLRDLIKRLLEKDPERRLGSRGGGEEIKAHSFFRGLDWDGIGELSRPPYLSMASDEEEEAAEFWGGAAGVQLHASGCEMGIDVREFFRKRTAERPPPRRRGTGKSSGSNYSPVIPAAHLAPHSSPVSCAVGCMELDEAELHGGDLSFS